MLHCWCLAPRVAFAALALALAMVLAGCSTTGQAPAVTEAGHVIPDVIPFTTLLEEQKELLTRVPCHQVHGAADPLAVQGYSFGCQAGTYVNVQILLDESPAAPGYLERVRLFWREWDEHKHPGSAQNQLITPYLNYIVDNFVPAQLHQEVRYNFARQDRKTWLAPDVRIDYRQTTQPLMVLHRLEILGRGIKMETPVVEPAPVVPPKQPQPTPAVEKATEEKPKQPLIQWQGTRTAPKPQIEKPTPKPVVEDVLEVPPMRDIGESLIQLLPPELQPQAPAPKVRTQPKAEKVFTAKEVMELAPPKAEPKQATQPVVKSTLSDQSNAYVPLAPLPSTPTPQLKGEPLTADEARHLRRLQMLGVDLNQLPKDDKYFGDEL